MTALNSSKDVSLPYKTDGLTELRFGLWRLIWLEENIEQDGGIYGPRHRTMSTNAVIIECARAIAEDLRRVIG